MKHWLLILLVAVSCACHAGKPETLVEGGYDEAEMSAATARAQRELASFIAVLESGKGTNFAVKMPIEDKGKIEHFWITGISYKSGEFTGKIGNEPGIVTNVRLGQTIKVRKEDISDWLFMRDGKMHGNYTLRPLLKTMTEQEAAVYKAMLAEP